MRVATVIRSAALPAPSSEARPIMAGRSGRDSNEYRAYWTGSQKKSRRDDPAIAAASHKPDALGAL